MSFNNPNQVHVGRDAINVTEGNQYNYAYNVNSDAETLRKASDAEALRILAQNAAPNACYDSEQRFPPPNCHEGTRLLILEKLSSRIEDKSKASSVLWVYGSAGVGKSAIAQHLAEKYAKSGRLAAAFFFSRSDSTRNNISPLVASIVYQFCQSESPLYTTLAPAIIDVIRSNPNIFRSSCEGQIEKLIIKACSNVDTVEQENPPNVIIIDGLDECIDRAEQERVLAIIRVLISYSTSYFSWIILLCSRPEPQIRYGFGHHGFIGHLEAFDVNSLDDINRDIHRYFVDSFATLQTKHRHALGQEMSSWPGEAVLDQLISRADGQFIFAYTVVKYVDVDYEPPQDHLDTILRIYVGQGESPYSPLDMLYDQILSSCHKWDKLQPLLRLICTPHPADLDRGGLNSDPTQPKWRSTERLALLLNFKVEEVSTLLIRLHSVLRMPEGFNREQNILLAHATFPEFLADPNRSGPFYTPAMPESEYCDYLATRLLRTLAPFTSSYPLYHLESFDSARLSWLQKVEAADRLVCDACWSWGDYCLKVVSPSADLLGELEKMDTHVIAAISLQLDLGLPLDWDSFIMWAKELGDSRVSMLVNRLGTTVMEVHVTPGPCPDGYLERRRMFGGIFNIERRLLPEIYLRLRTSPSVQSFEDAILGELRAPSIPSSRPWSIPGSNQSFSLRNILVVPRDIIPKVSKTLPIVRVTRTNGYTFERIYDTLESSDWSPMIRLLLGYVVDRTLTVSDRSGNPVQFPADVLDIDLICFATFFKERLAALNLGVKWSEGSFWLVDTTGQDSTRSSIRGSPPSSLDPTCTALHPTPACDSPPSSPDSDSSSVYWDAQSTLSEP